MDLTLIISLLISFLITLGLTPYWIKRARNANLVGKDIHKTDSRDVAEIGGLPVFIGIIFGVLSYVAIKTFAMSQTAHNSIIMGLLTTLLLFILIGLIDDILGWKIGIKQWQKPVLTFFAVMPLAVLNAGVSTINLPLLGDVNLGLLYPLLFIPVFVTVFANGFNMIAGYNGLEAGQGAIILFTLGFIVWQQGFGWVAMIAGCSVMALLAFLIFNKYPSKIFPGDTLTYPLGALIGIVAVLGSAEKAAVILFLPYVVEFFLKLRGRFRKESFAKVLEDGSLRLRYANWYGLEHVMLSLLGRFKRKVREYEVVFGLWLLQLVLVMLVLVLF